MISPKLTNCKECANIPDLLRKIDCKLAELGNNLYNNVVFMLHKPIASSEISQLLVYKRVLQHRFCDTHYAESCPTVSTEDIASKVIRLTAGCVPFCNEPTVCEITTCAIKPCPNPTTTTTSTSSTTTTSTSSTTTTTTTLNCNFNGVIDCSITTTTTTTPPPTTTTTTTYFPDPFGVPCLWSTNGGDPGLVGVYDFDNNTQIDVLVPNDFNETQGINRPMAASETHLYLTSVVLNDAPDGTPENFITRYDHVLLREWSIDATGVAPVLSYVREIKIETGQSGMRGVWGTRVQAIAIAESPAVGPSEHPGTSYWPEVPFTMLIVGMGYQTSGLVGVYSFDLNGGTLTPKENALGYNSVGFGNTYSSLVSLTGLLVTTDNNVIVSARYYAQEYDLNAFNYIKQYKGLPPTNRDDIGNLGGFIPGSNTNDWSYADDDNPFPTLNLQGLGVPQFSESWTDTKAMPLWGVNGLLQTLQPETNEVYTIQQTPYYDATLTTTIEDDSVWLVSAIPCADVRIVTPDELEGCTPTALPTLRADDEDGNETYIGPVSFEYSGMTVQASSVVFEGMRANPTSETYTTDCGITIPGGSVVFGGNTSMDPGSSSFPAFDYTLTFPIPVNNIPLRGSIFDTGDNFFFSTNATSTTISEDGGCFYNIQNGNEVYTDPSTSSGRGSGTFTITGSEDFTVLTIKGTNRGNGGGWGLGCTSVTNQPGRCGVLIEPKTNIRCDVPEYAGACNDTFRNWNTSGTNFTPIMHWNPDTGDTTVINFPPNAHFAIDSMGISMSENYIHAQIVGGTDQSSPSNNRWNWTRYSYDVSPQGVPVNLVWEGIIYEVDLSTFPELGQLTGGMEVISDDKIVVIGKEGSTTPCSGPLPYQTVFELTYPGSGNQMTGELIMRIGGNNVDNGVTICGTVQGFALIFDNDGNPEKLIYADYGKIEGANNPGQSVAQVRYNNNPNGDVEVISFSQDFGIEYHYNSPKGLAYYVDSNGNEKIFVGGQFNVQQYETSNPGQALPPGLIPPPFIDSSGNEQWFGWLAEVDINPPYTWTGVNDNVMPQYNGWAAQEMNTDTGTFAVWGLSTLNQCSNGVTGMISDTTTTTTTQPGETTTTTTTAVPGVRTIFTKFNLFNQSV